MPREEAGAETDPKPGFREDSGGSYGQVLKDTGLLGEALMSATILQFVPKPNPNRDRQELARMYGDVTAELMALDVFTFAMFGPSQFIDTAPSEWTPPKESA